MKKTTKALSILLAALMIALSLASCNNEPAGNEDATPTPSSEATPTPGEDVTEGGKYLDFRHESVDPKIKLPAYQLESNKVTFLMSFEYTAPDPLKFDAPRDAYGIEIEPIRTGVDDYNTKFFSLVMSDEAPDISHLGNDLAIISKGYLQPWDSYIDTTTALWEGVAANFESQRFNGGSHTLNIQPNRTEGVWYNKAIFSEYGLETPRELLEKGEWTWDTFRELAVKLTVDDDADGVPEIYGAAITNGLYLLNSTGVELISLVDGKISNNVRSADVARAIEFYSQLMIEDSVLYDGDAKSFFATGGIAMMWGGLWFRVAFPDLIKAGNVDFIPFPKDPNADAYYMYDSFSFYSLSASAAHPNAAAAYVSGLRYNTFVVDEEAVAEKEALSIDEQIEKYGWTNEMDAQYMEDFYYSDLFTPCESMYNQFQLGQFLGTLFVRPLQGEPWSSIAEELYPQCESLISNIING